MAELFKKYRIRKPSEEGIGEANYADPDKHGIIKLDEIPDPQFDMRYFEYNEKTIKKLEINIRGSFEYKALFLFTKVNLNVDHCAYYEGYSMKNGLTIELHHAPFTLYDITEAVVAKSMHEKKYFETFRVVEEVNRLHYQFLIGLTPLNPTLHKLVHSGKVPVHPKIIIGNWKEFYNQYQAFLNESAIKKYEEAIALEQAQKDVVIPQIMNYKPSKIESPITLPTADQIQKWIVDSKLAKLESLGDGK